MTAADSALILTSAKSRSGARSPGGRSRRPQGRRRRAGPRLAATLLAVLALGAASAAALDFLPYGPGAFAQLRKAHAGRPFALHFWSAACAPCLAELSEWAKIAARKPGLDIVFVDVDPATERARAEARLEKAGLGGRTHYAFADDFAEPLYFEVDPSWRGELPYTALVDAQGKLLTAAGAVDDPTIVEWLAKTGN